MAEMCEPAKAAVFNPCHFQWTRSNGMDATANETSFPIVIHLTVHPYAAGRWRLGWGHDTLERANYEQY
jgi:hypothetical protein